jgi:peroxiredoxin
MKPSGLAKVIVRGTPRRWSSRGVTRVEFEEPRMTMRTFGRLHLVPVVGALLVSMAGASPMDDRPASSPPVDRGIGQRLPDFTLKTAAGDQAIRLYGYARQQKKAIVLVFTGISCPVAEVYTPRLVDLARAYEPKGVVFLAINSNAGESAEEVAKHAKEHGINFPVLKDPKNLAADLALVERTPEVVVVDSRASIRYRGAIDDQYVVGKRKPEPTKHYLTDALEAILAGKDVAVAATPVEGCPIDRTEPTIAGPKGPRVRPAREDIAEAYKAIEKGAGAAEVGKVTYAADVAPIVGARCQSCHRPGQSAPFSLLTYDDIRRRSSAIAEAVEDRRMPPWHADPRHGHFANDRSLTPKQRATLLAWVEQGTPLGDPAALPAPAKFAGGWTIGRPDVVIELPKDQVIPAQGVIEYVNVRVPTNFKEDRWIQAAEAVPGDRSVVHHIIAFVLPPKQERRRPGEGHLCGYAPGDMPSVYPPGVAKRIPAGADIVFQLHYTPNGKVRTDRSKLGLIFAKTPVEHEAHTLGIANNKFSIAPGDPNSEVKSSHTVKKDVYLLSFMPHMHLRGKDFLYTLVPKDGPPEVLLSVPAYDFGWQSYYILDKPRLLKAGDRIDCVAHFDNSKDNPANPDSSKKVTWGDQTFEEMMIGYIDYYDVAPIGSGPAFAGSTPPSPLDSSRVR